MKTWIQDMNDMNLIVFSACYSSVFILWAVPWGGTWYNESSFYLSGSRRQMIQAYPNFINRNKYDDRLIPV